MVTMVTMVLAPGVAASTEAPVSTGPEMGARLAPLAAIVSWLAQPAERTRATATKATMVERMKW
jgi:hypothetical protein